MNIKKKETDTACAYAVHFGLGRSLLTCSNYRRSKHIPDGSISALPLFWETPGIQDYILPLHYFFDVALEDKNYLIFKEQLLT